MLYFIALIIFFIIPGILLFFYLNNNKALDVKSLIISTIIFAIVIIPADLYMAYRGVWIFGIEHTFGLFFLGMPLEEYLFYFTAIPTIMMFLQFVQHLRSK